MQKGAAHSAAVLRGVFPNGALATGSMGQNLFLEGRHLGKRNPSPGFRGYLSSFKPVPCLLELCSSNLSWMLKEPVEDARNIPLPLTDWQPWTVVSILLMNCVFLLLTATRSSLNPPQLPC